MHGPGAPLAGARALVTGASRRLGRAIALRLAAAGSDVAVHYRTDEEGARETVDAVRSRHGTRAVALSADLADREAPRDLVQACESALGPLTLLVNNAATFVRTPLDRLTVADFDHHMDGNARGPFLTMLEAGRRMQARGAGAIVNVADVAGLRPWPAHIPYSASKAALVSLTRGFARALAPEVRVNALAPGPMLPPAGEAPEQGEAAVRRTLLGRWGAPEDVAQGVLFLATSPYLTGVVLCVDGGRSVAW